MRNFIYLFIILIISCIMPSCTDPKSEAVDNLRIYYEELVANSDHYSSEEWDAFIQEYTYNDSIINTYQYTSEEMQEINDLRGRCASFLIKGAVNDIGKDLNNSIQGIGTFLNGLIDELTNGN